MTADRRCVFDSGLPANVDACGLCFAVVAGSTAGDEDRQNAEDKAYQTENQTERSYGASGCAGLDSLVADHEGEETAACREQDSADVQNEGVDRHTGCANNEQRHTKAENTGSTANHTEHIIVEEGALGCLRRLRCHRRQGSLIVRLLIGLLLGLLVIRILVVHNIHPFQKSCHYSIVN